jgi:hypothetical protein
MYPILEIVAVMLSPLVAVQVTVWRQNYVEARKRKLGIFHTLMMTRESWLSQEHVRALNSIDIEFHGERKAKKILEAWRAYLNQLNAPLSASEAEALLWNQTRTNRFVTLLGEMAKYFGYDFDETMIRSTSYSPRFYGELEAEGNEIRKLLLQLLRGERALPMTPVGAIAGDTKAGELKAGELPMIGKISPTEIKKILDDNK